MDEHKALVVYCTVPNVATGKKIARAVVQEGLCACVNLLPKISSFFIYEGEFCEEAEELLIIKTDAGLFKALERRIFDMHPYSVPEIIATEISDGSEPYMQWLKAALKPL